MSDTITPKERAEWRNRLKNGYFDPDHLHELTLRLLDALESAEARVKARNKHIHTLMSEALENERNFDGMKSQWQISEAEVARLTKALETQRSLTESAHATAQAAWGGEIPSPFPGHKRSSEDEMADYFAHLNCPLCGGSGHVGDCDATAAETVARLNKTVDWLAEHGTCPNKGLSYDNFKCDGTIPCRECIKEAARRAVAAGEES